MRPSFLIILTLVFLTRLSIRLSTTCLRSSSPCPRHTGWRVSEMTWCSSYTCIRDGEDPLPQSDVDVELILNSMLMFFRLYPVDKTRVNEYGVSYDEKPKGKSHKDWHRQDRTAQHCHEISHRIQKRRTTLHLSIWAQFCSAKQRILSSYSLSEHLSEIKWLLYLVEL